MGANCLYYKIDEEPYRTVDGLLEVHICSKLNFFLIRSEYNTGTFILKHNLWHTIFKGNETEQNYYTKHHTMCVYLNRVLEDCNRKNFGRHGTEEQTEILMDWCVCTGTERNINHRDTLRANESLSLSKQKQTHIWVFSVLIEMPSLSLAEKCQHKQPCSDTKKNQFNH